jgi:integrase
LHYNHIRPHSALGYKPPAPMARLCAASHSATLHDPQHKPLVLTAKTMLLTEPYGKAIFEEVQRLAKKAHIDLPIGLMDVRLHDLRRTLGSFQAAAGASQYVIGKSLGHKSQQATAIYARLNLDPVRQSVETAIAAMNKARDNG